MLMHMLTICQLFPAASRWMISCLAAVGCFHDLLIMIDESRFVIGLHQRCPFVVPRLFPSVEKRDKPSLTYISLKKQPTFVSPPNMMSVSERTLIFYPNARSLATFFKSRRLPCETLAPFGFVFILHYFTLL